MYRGINTAIIVGTMTDAQLHDIEGRTYLDLISAHTRANTITCAHI